MRMNNRYPWPNNVIRLIIDADGDLPFVITPKCEEQLMNALNYLAIRSEKKKRRVDMLLRYYKDGKTMDEIGKEFGVSRAIVSLEVRQAVRHLQYPSLRQRFMPLFVTYDEIDEYYRKKMATLAEREAKIEAREKMLNARDGVLSIDGMDLSVRAYNALARAGFKTSKDIIEAMGKSEDDPKALINVKNLGRKSYDQILAKMEELFGSDYNKKEG